jgi:hypothetical protein
MVITIGAISGGVNHWMHHHWCQKITIGAIFVAHGANWREFQFYLTLLPELQPIEGKILMPQTFGRNVIIFIILK